MAPIVPPGVGPACAIVRHCLRAERGPNRISPFPQPIVRGLGLGVVFSFRAGRRLLFGVELVGKLVGSNLALCLRGFPFGRVPGVSGWACAVVVV